VHRVSEWPGAREQVSARRRKSAVREVRKREGEKKPGFARFDHVIIHRVLRNFTNGVQATLAVVKKIRKHAFMALIHIALFLLVFLMGRLLFQQPE
jgi:hypothetical protein